MDTPSKLLISIQAWTCSKSSDYAVESPTHHTLSLAQARCVCRVPDPDGGAAVARRARRTGSQPRISSAQPTRARSVSVSGCCPDLHPPQDALWLDLAVAPTPDVGVIWLRLCCFARHHL